MAAKVTVSGARDAWSQSLSLGDCVARERYQGVMGRDGQTPCSIHPLQTDPLTPVVGRQLSEWQSAHSFSRSQSPYLNGRFHIRARLPGGTERLHEPFELLYLAVLPLTDEAIALPGRRQKLVFRDKSTASY